MVPVVNERQARELAPLKGQPDVAKDVMGLSFLSYTPLQISTCGSLRVLINACSNFGPM